MEDTEVDILSNKSDQLVRIEASNLVYNVKLKDKSDKWWKVSCCRKDKVKTILNSINMIAEPGELTAIMGPSGCGKTTLLDILSGRIINYEGEIYLNNNLLNINISKISGYVKQQDLLLPSATVKEVLLFSAFLRLPSSIPKKEKLKRVEELIKKLGLEKCSDSRIGDENKRGISGGELKRVSIGVELITNPRLLFLDEPTSGLDAASAYNLINLLKSLCKETKCTIITTIHQPNGHIFKLFDKFVLMESGEIIYQGPTQDAKKFFKECGYHCPKYMNPADYYMDVVTSSLSQELKKEESLSIRDMALKFKDSKFNKNALQESKTRVEPFNIQDIKDEKSTFFEQFSQLVIRSWRDSWRNPVVFQSQLFQHIFFGLLIGLMYIRLGNRDTDTRRDRAAAIYFIIINVTFPPALTAAFLIPKQRPIFNRERESGTYTLLPYILSTVIVGLPVQLLLIAIDIILCYWIVGFSTSFEKFMTFLAIIFLLLLVTESIGVFISTFSSTIDVATNIISLVLLVFMSFGGFLLKPSDVPKFFLVFDFLSPFKYAYRALLKSDMENLIVSCTPTLGQCPIECNQTQLCEYPCLNNDGASFIKEMGLDDSTIFIDVLILIGMFLIYRILSYISILLFKVGKKKYN